MQIEFFPVLYFQQLRWPLRVKKRLSPVVGPDYSSTVPTMWSRWPEPTLVDFPLQSAMIKAPPHGVSIASLQKPQKWSKASKCIIQLFRPFDFRICVTFSSLSFLPTVAIMLPRAKYRPAILTLAPIRALIPKDIWKPVTSVSRKRCPAHLLRVRPYMHYTSLLKSRPFWNKNDIIKINDLLGF